MLEEVKARKSRQVALRKIQIMPSSSKQWNGFWWCCQSFWDFLRIYIRTVQCTECTTLAETIRPDHEVFDSNRDKCIEFWTDITYLYRNCMFPCTLQNLFLSRHVLLNSVDINKHPLTWKSDSPSLYGMCRTINLNTLIQSKVLLGW